MNINDSFLNPHVYVSFFINNFLPGALIFFVGWFVANKLIAIIKEAMVKSRVDESIISFSNSVLKVIFRGIVILMVVTCFGVNISSIIATLGAALVTVGLALKDNLSNAASGMIIIINKPFKIGDSLETRDVTGTVTKIEMLSTTLKTADNKEIVVPNSRLTADYIINSSVNLKRRLDITLPIKKDTKFSDIQNILETTISNDENILKAPAPAVSIGSFNNKTIDVDIKVWCDAKNYDSLEKNLCEKIKLELDENNINF